MSIPPGEQAAGARPQLAADVLDLFDRDYLSFSSSASVKGVYSQVVVK
jgi:hypothetical protein